MSKGTGGTRTKSVREAYVEQLPYGQGLTGYMNRKRKPFTHLNAVDDNDLAYRSTSDYLRGYYNPNPQSEPEMISERHIPRTKTASELALKSTNRSASGNPKYKAQEDYYEEIQLLKKDMKTVKNENSILRAKIRRLEEDNVRKQKEIGAFYETNQDGDLRGALTGSSTDRSHNSSSNPNVALRLKQRIFKLELQLKEKESKLEEIQSDQKWTKSKELEIQNRALFSELDRQRFEKSHQLSQNGYSATIEEEKKQAIQKLTKERDGHKEENESLRKRVAELEQINPTRTTHSSDDSSHPELLKAMENLKQKCKNYENEIEQMNDNLLKMRRERDEYHKSFDRVTGELEELKRPKSAARSSPLLSRNNEEQMRENLNLSRRTSKEIGNRTPRSSPNVGDRLDSPLSVTPRKNASRPTTPTRKLAVPIVTSINDPSVKRFREKRAATVIQRGWRKHDKSQKDQVRAKPSVRPSPHSSFKEDNSDNERIRSRPTSASSSTANEPALRAIQAVLRGYLNRTEMDKTPNKISSPKPKPRSSVSSRKSERTDSDDNENIPISTPSKPLQLSYGNEIKRDPPSYGLKLNAKPTVPIREIQPKTQSYKNITEPTSRIRRDRSPPPNSHRPSSPGFKANLPSNREKSNLSGSSSTTIDRELPSKQQRPSSPSISRKPLSPANSDRSSSRHKSPDTSITKKPTVVDSDEDDIVAT
ncbi:unnamed protein product [Rotaria socialis]|uniref:Uncharacterized protein n=1 Tax=Rotaria socialis TaxID=392032 RepID=A0A818JDY6_9BILA|nr:unnamed protein product [Rotaria socialis]CAF4220426.1 unnamed protein product [Rotaria socialis]